MANRSHLYTCDEVPGGKGFHARGLSEFNYDIPLAHKLMAAGNPRIVRSAIWEHDIGILADRAGAFERTLALFDKLAEGDLPNRAEFDEELAAMKEFLASTPPSKYILLEAGEILDMMDGDLGQLIIELHGELLPLADQAARAVAGQADDWLADLRANWEEKARPGYWSDILYYSFDNAAAGDSGEAAEAADEEAPAKTPAKKPAAKKPAAKKPAAKKPAAKKPVAKAKAMKPVVKAAKAAKKPAKKAAQKATKKPAKKAAKKAAKKRR